MSNSRNFCCFSGHRVIPHAQKEEILSCLDINIKALIARGCNIFVVGGALGFDTYAAKAVIALRDDEGYPIRLIVVAPYEGQSLRWNISDQFCYDNIRNGCDDFISLSSKYQNGCMQIRNRHMVDLSAYCISYCTNLRSGTGQTIAYANKQGLVVINLATSLNFE